MRPSAIGGLVALFVVLFGINLVFFRVNEWQQVIVTQFGEPKRIIREPGLFFKLPDPIQKVHRFNKWLLDYNSKPESIYTKDKKVLLLNNYARWRIIEPLVFLQALRTQAEGLFRLDDIIYSELRRELGQHNLSEVISTSREELMRLVTERSDKAARVYGIEVLDVRIKRADLPLENEAAVYERMRAERSREAKAYRSEGEEQALKIRAETDLEAAEIMAEAYEKSQKFRGEGDGEALKTYAKAYRGAEDFYKFSRTLEAYEKSLGEKTVIVQPLNSDFFKYLKGKQ
jgi:membrane protease subunit HflC